MGDIYLGLLGGPQWRVVCRFAHPHTTHTPTHTYSCTRTRYCRIGQQHVGSSPYLVFLVHAAYQRTRQYVEYDEDEKKLKDSQDAINTLCTHKSTTDVMVREPENKNVSEPRPRTRPRINRHRA